MKFSSHKGHTTGKERIETSQGEGESSRFQLDDDRDFLSFQAELSSVQTVLVNCMSLRSSHSIFPLLADKLKAPGGQSGLQRLLTAPGPTV